MKICFLDFDGVMNALLPHEMSGPFSKAACSHLNILLAKIPDLRIVISSAWRRQGIDYCRQLLKDNGIDPIRVIDITPILPDVGHLDRDKEIEQWLNGHKVDNFVILEDHYPMPDFKDHLVKTNSYVGFTEADLRKALDILEPKTI